MDTFKSLLAATDFSDDAQNAVGRAAQIASDHQAALELLHVMSGPSLASLRELFHHPEDAEAKLVAESRRELEETATRLSAAHRLNVTARVEIGTVLTGILAAAQEADLLVMGARGQNPVRDLLLGTTAERLLGKRTRPALVVKGAPQGSYRRILVPIDLSPYSEAVVDTAMRIAPTADIQVCHAFDVPYEGKLWLAGVAEEQIHQYRIQARQHAKTELLGLIERVASDNPRRPAALVERGDAVRVILDKAAELDADLIVIGKHGRSAVEELILGGVTRHVLSDAACDVLIVNEKRPAA